MEKVYFDCSNFSNENRIKMIKALVNADVKDSYHYVKFVEGINSTNNSAHFIRHMLDNHFDVNIFEETIYIDTQAKAFLEEDLKESELRVENIKKLLAMKHRYVK